MLREKQTRDHGLIILHISCRRNCI